MPAPEDDLALLVDAARSAGSIAMGYFRNAPEKWDKPDNAGPVTAADYAVDSMLRETLTAARPGTGWLSEETEDDPARLQAREVFIVDPIDGTRAFIAGETSWAHSLALARDGKVVAGVVYLPAADLLYTATEAGAAVLNGSPIRVSPARGVSGARTLSAARFLKPDLWPGGAPPVERHFRPSLAWRLALVAEGRFDAMLTLGDTWEWDIAAGCLIAERAGARITDRDGTELRFNNAHPVTPGVIAAGPDLQAQLMAYRTSAGRAEPAGNV
ncbi:3'(2'),5'-bisphosphate nucleotidase CysQ [Frigidibacter sp. ROC022]|uniref:3'(2'),5'-bisphosphate nucleotidase CysQ n=1 Tax=Frigidibacter sp. ROC022 TaxID=2971796 RepID=UPI00215ABAC2|nr:3'(2'),5'-bisphosphate nucleotidase CysQ [Frigidibacter sp. ROC022]MCR8724938.1 3'(2'),5'-bisphosphate nucleotidase CysQ [Frigidibacter sp. ROC022]